MTKRYLVLIMVFFLLVACTGQEQVPITETPIQETETQSTEAVTVTEVIPTGTEVIESSKFNSASGVQMECTLISDQPDAPAEFVEIFGVTEDDWVIGSDTAAVTFVEYGDFQ